MIGRDYFTRQATTLLRLARATKDPQVHAKLASKAADLQARVGEISQEPPCSKAEPRPDQPA